MHVVKIIAYVLLLIGKTPIVLTEFWYRRRSGIKAFERELHKTGLGIAHAAELTHIYKSMIPGWKYWIELSKKHRTGSEPNTGNVPQQHWNTAKHKSS